MARQRSITSDDGTRIVYQIRGRGPRWVVIANGYGGTFCAWDEIIEPLADRYRFLLWDYRGLHRSAKPRDRSRLQIQDHCRDLERICSVEGIERMSLAGWSVGVQVALEQYRRTPKKVDALVLVNGAHGRVLNRSIEGAVRRRLTPAVLKAMRAAAPVLAPGVLLPLRAAAKSRFTGTLLRRSGFFNGESASLTESARSILRLDYSTYSHMILLADEHDTADVLPTIEVPTMVVAGDRDAITSPALARSIAARIPSCEYREVAGATHYGLMEFPSTYAAHMAELLAATGD